MFTKVDLSDLQNFLLNYQNHLQNGEEHFVIDFDFLLKCGWDTELPKVNPGFQLSLRNAILDMSP